jgi:hypothetical protein
LLIGEKSQKNKYNTNINIKNKSESGFVQLVAIAAIGGIIAGVILLWIQSANLNRRWKIVIQSGRIIAKPLAF